MSIRGTIEIGPYKNTFDPQQIETEQHITRFLQNNTTADEATSKVLAETIVKLVLGEFRPELFTGYVPDVPKFCGYCGGSTFGPMGEYCEWCNGSGVVIDG